MFDCDGNTEFLRNAWRKYDSDPTNGNFHDLWEAYFIQLMTLGSVTAVVGAVRTEGTRIQEVKTTF